MLTDFSVTTELLAGVGSMKFREHVGGMGKLPPPACPLINFPATAMPAMASKIKRTAVAEALLEMTKCPVAMLIFRELLFINIA
jgi:hypothetical protein